MMQTLTWLNVQVKVRGLVKLQSAIIRKFELLLKLHSQSHRHFRGRLLQAAALKYAFAIVFKLQLQLQTGRVLGPYQAGGTHGVTLF